MMTIEEYLLVKYVCGKAKVFVSEEMIMKQFGYQKEIAAKNLKISSSMLTRFCNEYGIRKWPYREIRKKRRKTKRMVICCGFLSCEKCWERRYNHKMEN